MTVNAEDIKTKLAELKGRLVCHYVCATAEEEKEITDLIASLKEVVDFERPEPFPEGEKVWVIHKDYCGNGCDARVPGKIKGKEEICGLTRYKVEIYLGGDHHIIPVTSDHLNPRTRDC